MSSAFFETSKQIANDFLQSIVFIDDKAFKTNENKTNHDFDVYAITKAFALQQKLCAVYRPQTTQDIEHLAQLAKKADITVLDWQINLVEEPVPEGSEEEDADDVDHRGAHTLKIIDEIISDPVTGKGTLKLILVYTGEAALQDIADIIFESLKGKELSGLKKGTCEVTTENIKILVIAKSERGANEANTTESKFKHVPDFNSRIKTYEELPEYILEEFTKMTSGLLSNFILRSLTIIKDNTFKILKLYNQGLDTSFLSHRLVLPNQDDSKDQLIEVFADSILALLQYNDTKESLSIQNIKNWIDTQNFSKTISFGKKVITIDNDFVKRWAESNFVKAVSERWSSSNYGELGEDTIKSFERKLNDLTKQESSLLLGGEGLNSKDIEYSILTHHKSIFKPALISPKLTLGAIVKGSKKGGYWVCIQQRCDSVRVDNERRFLFLPLTVSDKKFHFITSEGIKLELQKKSFDLRTIKFIDTTGEGVIKANQLNDKFYFEPVYKDGHKYYNSEEDEVYEWILDLKDLHAQRIAHEFANQLSRVGLDESEWLRRRYS